MRLSLASKAKLSNQTVGIIATELRPSPHYCSVVIDDPYFGGHYLVWICTEHSAFDLFNIDQQATWSFLCPNLLLSSNHIKIQCEDQPKYQAHPAITFTFVEPRIQHQAEDYKQKPL